MSQINLFNINNFQEYLVDAGIAKSRVLHLTQAVEFLYRALCAMDYRNLRVTKDLTINQLLIVYAKFSKSRIIDLDKGESDGTNF